MRSLHATTAATHGLHGGATFPAERIGTLDSGRLCPPARRGALVLAAIASALSVSAVAFGGQLPTSYIYGVDDAGTLWYAEPASEKTAQLFLSGIPGTWNGFAFDAGRDQFFATNFATNDLYWWQNGSTSFSVLASGSSYTTAPTYSAAFYNDAYWFFVGTSNELRQVAITYDSGAPKDITVTSYVTSGTGGYSAIGGGDLVITPQGLLYAFTSPTSGGEFFTLDLTTIGSGTVGGYQYITTNTNVSMQLSFSPDYTTLFGQNYNDGQWYTVDTNSGDLSPIGTFKTAVNEGGTVGFRDLGGSSIQPVPEPDTLALAAMGGGIVAWWGSRRRRSPATGADDATGPQLP